MALVDFEQRPKIETHYYPFDRNITPLSLRGGHQAQLYIPSDDVRKEFRNASEKIKLADFDVILVNSEGGWFTYNQLASLQDFQGVPVEIEYHRPEGDSNPKIAKAVPEELKNRPDLRILIIDDIYDKGGTLANIREGLVNSIALVAVRKRNVPGSLKPTGPVEAIMETDNVWLFGLGMNADTEGDGWPKDFGRDWTSLMVKV